MEIDSIVANSALIRAREGGGSKGRSWKWREMLRFPQINQCADLAINIERDYYSLCVKQPIGKKLFRLFCQSRPDLKNYMFLQDALEEFETKSDEDRRDFGVSVIGKFLNRQSKQCVLILLKHEQNCNQNLKLNPHDDVFRDCREDLHKYLRAEPFLQYQDSMYFDRFLQWKALERKPVTKHDFKQYRLLGKGGFGEVWACQVRATGMMYACKKLEKTHVKKRKGETMALNEKQILEGLDSRFVVNLAYAYETKHALCMVLTMMSGGDLKFHIYNIGGPGLDRDRARFYAAEVCCGLLHLHQKSILYRDVKPENILLDDNGHIRISDLGLAVRLTEKKTVRGRVGTLGYMAPEVIGNKYYGVSTDWWGFGCLIYEMTAGQPPYRKKGEHMRSTDLERRIQMEKEEYGERFSKEVKDICMALLTKDPKERLGCGTTGGKEVQSHPFFQQINFRMLEAGLVEPPFKPDVSPQMIHMTVWVNGDVGFLLTVLFSCVQPRLVYCSDVQDIDEFSSVKGVTLDETDEDFYSKFNTGRVPVAWQNEIVDTGCFKELNTFGPEGSRSPDLDWCQIPDSPKRGLLHRIFRRHHPSDPSDESKLSLVSDDAYTKSALSSMPL